VTDPGEQLRETFETHETLAPDPAAVYARVQELARLYKRRRRGAQVVGGAVLGAGLIAGAVALPSALSRSSGGVGIAAPAAAPASAGLSASAAPSVALSPSLAGSPSAGSSVYPSELEREWAAYFAAGYGYDDAVRLAALWHTSQDIGQVKAEAGRRLLAGETLPVSPHPNPTTPQTPDPSASADELALTAFFNAGYVWDDAVQLATLWKLADPSEAKVVAGKKLLAGETLPIKR
jgi:hypothetical protein